MNLPPQRVGGIEESVHGRVGSVAADTRNCILSDDESSGYLGAMPPVDGPAQRQERAVIRSLSPRGLPATPRAGRASDRSDGRAPDATSTRPSTTNMKMTREPSMTCLP